MMASTTASTAKAAKQEGRVPPASGDENSAGNDCTSWDCAVATMVVGTVLAGVLVVQALTTFGDKPASLMLELSTVLCALLYAWACFITRQLTVEAYRISSDSLRRVLWWIVDAGAVAVLAGWAFGTVAAMLVMYATSLCVAGLFTWCLVESYRTTSIDDTTSASQAQDKAAAGSGISQDGLSKKNSNANAKGSSQLNAQVYQTLDLEAGLRRTIT